MREAHPTTKILKRRREPNPRSEKERSRTHPASGREKRRGAGRSGRNGSRHLFDNWAGVLRRLASAKRVTLFLDFDGTLVPLRLRTKAARLDPATREVLRNLACSPNVKLYIISGRLRNDLRKAIALPGAICIGLHGWELEGRDRLTVGSKRLSDSACRELARRLSGLPHILFRKKGPCFEIHYRGAPDAIVRKAHGLVHQVVDPLSPRIRVLHGHKIWEILPSEIEGKGAAVKSLLAGSSPSELPIYIGDDTSDESAFRVLSRGITVRVGRPRPTLARYELRGPQEVASFLNLLAEMIP